MSIGFLKKIRKKEKKFSRGKNRAKSYVINAEFCSVFICFFEDAAVGRRFASRIANCFRIPIRVTRGAVPYGMYRLSAVGVDIIYSTTKL